MMPTVLTDQAPVPPPSYHRAQDQREHWLHINALKLIETLHLLALCRSAVQLAHRRCPPPLPICNGLPTRAGQPSSGKWP